MQGSSVTLFSCDEPDCPRTGNAGFSRTDNLADHMRRRHGRILGLSRAPALAASSLTPPDIQTPALPQPEEQQMSSSITVPVKRRCEPTTAQSQSLVDIEDTSVGKKPRQESSNSDNNPQPTASKEALTREVESLRKATEKLLKERDILVGVIARLT